MSNHSLETQLTELLESTDSQERFCRNAVKIIHRFKPYYDWVGIYRLTNNSLVLLPHWYVGLEPEHQHILMDDGICGAAASSRETIVVDDVRSDPRYLACSIATRSEIVVPILANDVLFGVLDLDSDKQNAFISEDITTLESAAQIIAQSFK